MTLPRMHPQPGAPMYGPLRRFVAHAWHTTEGAPGLAGAVATAKWQATAGNSSGGSYLGILTCEPWPTGPAVLVVTAPLENGYPADRAVGGVSRGSTAWRPSGRALRLPAEVLRDPNAYLRQYALAGRTADFVRQGYPAQLIAAAVALVREDERRHPGVDPLQTGHYEYQANRTDPGTDWIPQLIRAYNATPAPAPVDKSALRELWPEERPTVRALDAMPEGAMVYVNAGSELHPRWWTARTPAVGAGHRFTVSGRAIVTLADGRQRACWRLWAPGYPHDGTYLDERLVEGVGFE